MPVDRKDVDLYKNRLTEFYQCLTKLKYVSQLVATKQAYSLECIRPGRTYNIYTCPWCGYYHIGRKSKREKD